VCRSASEDPPRWRCGLAVVAGSGEKWIDEAEDRLGGGGGVDKGVPPFWVPAVDVEVETKLCQMDGRGREVG
jgi:hypothetical protein